MMKPRDYLAAAKTPMSLRLFLEAALAEPRAAPLPELYAKAKRDFSNRGAHGVSFIKSGDRVRITDVDRFGSVGITNMLDEPKTYQVRASLAELTDFSSRL